MGPGHKRRKSSKSIPVLSRVNHHFRTLRFEQCEDRRMLNGTVILNRPGAFADEWDANSQSYSVNDSSWKADGGLVLGKGWGIESTEVYRFVLPAKDLPAQLFDLTSLTVQVYGKGHWTLPVQWGAADIYIGNAATKVDTLPWLEGWSDAYTYSGAAAHNLLTASADGLYSYFDVTLKTTDAVFPRNDWYDLQQIKVTYSYNGNAVFYPGQGDWLSAWNEATSASRKLQAYSDDVVNGVWEHNWNEDRLIEGCRLVASKAWNLNNIVDVALYGVPPYTYYAAVRDFKGKLYDLQTLADLISDSVDYILYKVEYDTHVGTGMAPSNAVLATSFTATAGTLNTVASLWSSAARDGTIDANEAVLIDIAIDASKTAVQQLQSQLDRVADTMYLVYQNQLASNHEVSNTAQLMLDSLSPMLDYSFQSGDPTLTLNEANSSLPQLLLALESRRINANAGPNTPSCRSPADAARNVSLTPTLTSSAFFDTNSGDSHRASEWQIATDSNFAVLVWGALDTDSNKASELAPTLSNATRYYWRVRHQDNHSVWSNWSSPSSFTTLAAAATAPVVTISSPTTNSAFTTANDYIYLSGTVQSTAPVSYVTWQNTTNGASGTISGPISPWGPVHIGGLSAGPNTIVVTAYDMATPSNTGTDTIIVTYDTSAVVASCGVDKDTVVTSGDIYHNYSEGESLVAGFVDNPYSQKTRSLVQFTLVPPGSTVKSAVLKLYYLDSGGTGPIDVTAKRITEAWDGTGVTWFSQPGYTSADSWTTSVSTLQQWYSWDLTEIVKDWVEGGVPNYGLMLISPAENSSTSNYRGFYSKEASSNRPRLEVTYIPGRHPPAVSVTTPLSPQCGNVTIDYSLTDGEADACSVVVQYSPDGGASWYPATRDSSCVDGTNGLSSSISGTPHTFVWASATDLGDTNAESVKIRITPSDPDGTGSANVTGPFSLHNNVASPTARAYVVNSLADVVLADGVLTLREAIQAADTNCPAGDALAGSLLETDVISFAPGLFNDGVKPIRGTITLNGSQLEIRDKVVIEGPGQDLLTIDANGQSRAFEIAYGCVAAVSGVSIAAGGLVGSGGGGVFNLGTLTLSDCTISGCWASAGGGFLNNGAATITDCTISDNSGESGGGIMNQGVLRVEDSIIAGNRTYGGEGGGIFSCITATIINCSISGNSSSGYAGGISNIGGSMTVMGSILSQNTAYDAAGIYCCGGSLDVANSVVSENVASGSRSLGGGIRSRSATVTVSDSVVSNNACNGAGGGIFSTGGEFGLEGSLVVTNSVISGNVADGNESEGGGIFAYGSFLISHSTLVGNRAEWGGGIYISGSPATITDSYILGNVAYVGGGIMSYGGGSGATVVTNCVVTGNSACYGLGVGGGIGNYYGAMALVNSTIAGNSCSVSGSGVWSASVKANPTPEDLFDPYAVSIANSIIAFNSGPANSDVFGLLSPDGGFNLIGVDPHFVRNPSDGGDGWGDDLTTANIDESENDDYGNLHLQPGSVAIGGGSNALALDAQGNPIVTDLDGNPRVVGPHVDIGAYEYQDSGAPTDISLLGTAITENSASSTVVGDLATADPDAGDTFTYTLLDNAGGRFKIVGSQVRVDDGSLLDYETANSHTITIRATDAVGLTFDKTFTINVLDVPEVLSWSTASVHSGVGEAALAIPDDGSFTEPRAGGVSRLLVTFSEPIDAATFTSAAVQIAGTQYDGSPVDLSSILIATSLRGDNTVGVIDFSTALPDVAKYTVRINGVKDLVGYTLGGDTDRVFAALKGDVSGDGVVGVSDLSRVRANKGTPISPAVAMQFRADVSQDGRADAADYTAVLPFVRHDVRGIAAPVLLSAQMAHIAAMPAGALVEASSALAQVAALDSIAPSAPTVGGQGWNAALVDAVYRDYQIDRRLAILDDAVDDLLPARSPKPWLLVRKSWPLVGSSIRFAGELNR